MHNDIDEKLHQLCATNDELSTLLKQYEEENKLLLSQITHEIRNPLTLIYSTLQLIEHKNPDITQLNYWKNVKEDMKDIFTLLDDLSIYNHSSSLHISKTNLNHLLSDLCTRFEALVSKHNASIQYIPTKDSIPYLTNFMCDEGKLKQVFTNLIKNAVEAVNENGNIVISTEYFSQSHTLYFYISNTGAEIPKEDQEAIFSPFVTHKSGGTGLGLPTAKRIIESHNGTIEVTSKKNKTTFTITLPAGNCN